MVSVGCQLSFCWWSDFVRQSQGEVDRMKRFVVELLVEDTEVRERGSNPALITADIVKLVKLHNNPLEYKLVGFTFRKERPEDVKASS